MEAISVFDIFKIGVGPSSSHTLGPWRAALRFSEKCRVAGIFDEVLRIQCDLYGSLAKTGIGHGTDLAVIWGLCGKDPETCDTEQLQPDLKEIEQSKTLHWNGQKKIHWVYAEDMVFHRDITLPFHPNGLTLTAFLADGRSYTETFYSIGGGFIVQEGQTVTGSQAVSLPHPIEQAKDLLNYCVTLKATIPEVVWRNERTWRSEAEIRSGLLHIWETMRHCAWRGAYTKGELPGGLKVVRRAANMNHKLLQDTDGLPQFETAEAWLQHIRALKTDFRQTLKWVSCFAMAVNEENAAFGRVVTAPTNGAAGVIPAVLLYYVAHPDSTEAGIIDFLLTAGEVGSLFKKGATISAAMGGCQAEIGVSSAMAAAGLTQVLGGSPEQVLMAGEIAMEHHLGLTCDPIAGLVQIPCIERNTMGAVKAITASQIALESDPAHAKVSLDAVIRSMWETALDMNTKYKETSEGGLAVQIPVSVSEC